MAGIFDQNIFQNESGAVGQKLFQVGVVVTKRREVWWPWSPGIKERRRRRAEAEALEECERRKRQLEELLAKERLEKERIPVGYRMPEKAQIIARIRHLEIEIERLERLCREEEEELLLLL